MRLSYFDKLSPDPIQIQNVGGIKSPTLRDISSVGFNTYEFYLSILLMDVKSFFAIFYGSDKYDNLSEQEKSDLSIWDLFTSDEWGIEILENVFNFFIAENVKYSDKYKAFLISMGDKIVGTISKDVYVELCDLICQLNNVKSDKEDLSKIKSKKALEIMKKIQKGRAEKQKKSKEDKNLELGNVISAVANKSNSLNIINVWDLTVFQLWDCFARLSNNSIYDIESMSVAVYGNENNHFDAASWFKRINTDN